MQYEEFRNAVLGLLEEDKEWSVHAEWQEVPAVLTCGDDLPAEDFIELEQEKGPFYELTL